MEKLVRLYLFKRNDYDGLKEYIKSQIPEDYVSYEDDYGNMYCVSEKSDSKVCICAHLDQVPAGDIARVCEFNGFLFGEDKDGYPANLGADDKNGVWVAINAAQHKSRPRLAFFLDEEVGRKGSKAADASFFEDVAYSLVVDRKGKNDIIYGGSNRQYSSVLHLLFKEVNPTWQFTRGISCDADSIRKYCDCINMSCGYYRAHTTLEYTNFSELEEALNAVNRMLDAKLDKMGIFDKVKDFNIEVYKDDDK